MKQTANWKLTAVFVPMALIQVILSWFTIRAQTVQLFTLFALAFILYFLLCSAPLTRRQIGWLIAGSIGLRLIWLFAFPQLSDDWARFVWDGRLQAVGHNPFSYLPAQLVHSQLPGSEVADPALFKALNSPGYFTVYPPILQGMFTIAAWLFPKDVFASIVMLRVFILLGEAGVILVLQKLLSAWGMAPRRVLLYALNPLVIAELTGNVHHEGIVIFFVFAMLLTLHKGWFWMPAFLLACAIATKLVPLIFLPLLLAHFGLRKGLLFCSTVLAIFTLSWIPFIQPALLGHATASIGLYFRSFEFNGSIYYLVRDIVYHCTGQIAIETIAPILGVTSMLLILLYTFIKRRNTEAVCLPVHFAFVLTIYLAFTTMVHPWYIIPLVALSSLTQLRFPIIWSAMIVSSYFEYHTTPPVESNIQLWLEYGVVLLSITWDLHRHRHRISFDQDRMKQEPATRL